MSALDFNVRADFTQEVPIAFFLKQQQKNIVPFLCNSEKI